MRIDLISILQNDSTIIDSTSLIDEIETKKQIQTHYGKYDLIHSTVVKIITTEIILWI